MSNFKFGTYDSTESVITRLMLHGATREQAKSIIDGMATVPFSGPQNPEPQARTTERAYHAAKWAVEKAKEYGKQNAEQA